MSSSDANDAPRAILSRFSLFSGAFEKLQSLLKLLEKKYWLGRQDSNLRMAASKAAALPLGDAPTRMRGLKAGNAS
jgi:hypothetical protein